MSQTDTPSSRHRRQKSVLSTPGDRSVASARSNRSFRSTSVRSVASAADSESGVAWNIKAQLAQDIEDQFPLASGGISLLLNQPGQALSKFLTARNKALGEDIYGKRGDEIRDKLQDLTYRWKQKSHEEYDKHVLRKHKIVRRAGKPQGRKACGDSDDEEADGQSSLSSAGSLYENAPTTPKTPKTPKPPLSKRRSSKRNLVGKTITTTSPPTAATTNISDFSPPFSNKTIESKMQSMNACKWFLVVLVSFFFLASTLGLLLSLSDHKSQHRLSRAQPGSDLVCIGRP